MSRGEMEESGGLRGELREGTEASDECEGRGTDGLLLEEGKLSPTGYGVRAERKEVSVFTFRERYFTHTKITKKTTTTKTIWVFHLWYLRAC